MFTINDLEIINKIGRKNGHELIKIDLSKELIVAFKCITHNVEFRIAISKIRNLTNFEQFKDEIINHLALNEEEWIIKNIIE